jgi:hypothetical protein
MSTIIISPTGEETEDSSEVVQLEILVSSEDFIGLFDVLEMWRSTSGEDGPYEEITALTNRPARIPKDAGDPPASPVTGPSINILGNAMTLLVNEQTEVFISFTAGLDPKTFQEVATDITTQGLLLVEAYVEADGRMVVQTKDVGVDSILRVVEGDEDENTAAATMLGLPTTEPQSLAYGRSARIPLLEDEDQYSFTDPYSSSEYYYKTRFRNSLTGAVSEFSEGFSVGAAVGVTQANLVCGRLELVQANGRPLQNQEVRLHVGFTGDEVDDKVVAGDDLVRSTDENGRVDFVLVRGLRVTVAVPGTDLSREIIVPTDSTISLFNLLDPTVVTGEDMFKVQVPDLVVAERRTL